VHASDADDKRLCPFTSADGKLHTGPLYQLLMTMQGTDSSISKFIRKNRALPRVQFFAWLLTQNRIQCRANLVKKHVVQDATCEVCVETEEKATHIIFQCPFAKNFWRALQFDIPAHTNTSALDELPRPDHVPTPKHPV
jgi:hypothetical protein